jgi:signal peptidase II
MPERSDTAIVVALTVFVAAIDQLTKFFVVSNIGRGRRTSKVEILHGWLALEYTENRGAAFGLLAGVAPVLTWVSILIMTGLLWHYYRQIRPPLWHTLAIGAIAGGALGNLVDRVRLGHVIDFVSVGPWPNFNVADSAITVGALVLLWGLTRPLPEHGVTRPIDQEN